MLERPRDRSSLSREPLWSNQGSSWVQRFLSLLGELCLDVPSPADVLCKEPFVGITWKLLATPSLVYIPYLTFQEASTGTISALSPMDLTSHSELIKGRVCSALYQNLSTFRPETRVWNQMSQRSGGDSKISWEGPEKEITPTPKPRQREALKGTTWAVFVSQMCFDCSEHSRRWWGPTGGWLSYSVANWGHGIVWWQLIACVLSIFSRRWFLKGGHFT